MKRTRSQSISELRDLIEIPLKHPELYFDLGIPPPKAVLLYGVTGVGKTHLIKKASERAEARLVSINLENITRDSLFEIVEKETSKSKPIVFYLVMHNPDAINQELISALAKILDGELDIDLNQVIFAGSTIRPSFPNELTRPGRFDRELEISLPNEKERLEILHEIIEGSRIGEDVNLEVIAEKCRGYTPADLLQLLKTAARLAIRQTFSDEKLEVTDSNISTSNIKMNQSHFLEAIDEIQPTVYKEMGFSKPNVSWKNLAGHTKIKNSIEKKVIEPLQYTEFFRQAEVSAIRGIILYGPPGNGKTTLAKAITTALDAHFIYINASDFIGNTKSNLELTQLFDIADEVEPTVIFIDEADSMFLKREDAKEHTVILINEFLTLMDGRQHESRTLVIAATNFIDKIDDAVKRPGRLEMQLFVGPPQQDERKEVFELLVKSKNYSEKLDFNYLSELTEPNANGYFSFSDLVAIVREAGSLAAQEAIKRNLNPENVEYNIHHFEQVIEQYPPSISMESMLMNQNRNNKSKSEFQISPKVMESFIHSLNNEDKIELFQLLKDEIKN